jgi:hypothetical protein
MSLSMNVERQQSRARPAVCTVAVAALLMLAACPRPPTDWFYLGDEEIGTDSIFGPIPSPTPALCQPEPCDDPGGVVFTGDFTVVDNGDGTRSAVGGWIFTLYEYDGQSVGAALCTQQWRYTADFIPVTNTVGCDPGGAQCISVCPYDDPDVEPSPSGQCAGRMINLEAMPDSYFTDCRFISDISWFHPESTRTTLLEQFLYYFPLETLVPSGTANYPTWGDWAQAISDPTTGALADYQPALQVSYVRRGEADDTWSNQGFLFSTTFAPPGGPPRADGVGHHSLLGPYILVFN